MLAVTAGLNATIRCYSNTSQAAIRWVRADNTPISNEVIDSSGYLTIINATSQNTRRYNCIMANIAGVDQAGLSVTVICKYILKVWSHVLFNSHLAAMAKTTNLVVVRVILISHL